MLFIRADNASLAGSCRADLRWPRLGCAQIRRPVEHGEFDSGGLANAAEQFTRRLEMTSLEDAPPILRRENRVRMKRGLPPSASVGIALVPSSRLSSSRIRTVRFVGQRTDRPRVEGSNRTL